MRKLSEEQGLSKLEHLVKHLRSPTTDVHKHILIALHWFQYTLGLSQPILKVPTENTDYSDSVWFKDLTKFLAKHKISLDIENPGVEQKRREHDSFFMDHVLEKGQFSQSELKRINYVRLHLDVLLISDMASASGQTILEEYYTGKLTEHAPTIKRKVNQPRPECPKTWTLWRKACQLLIQDKNTRKLKQPLGDWNVTWQQLRQHRHLHDSTSNQIYKFDITNNQWTKHEPDPQWPYRYNRKAISYEGTPPMDCKPIDVKKDTKESIRAIEETTQMNTMEPPTPPTIVDWLLGNVEETAPSPEENPMTVGMDQFKAASDGSVVGTDGTFGWVISDPEGNRLAKGLGRAFGHPMSSYRAEAFGMSSIITYWTTNFPQQQLLLVCDNKALVDRIEELTVRQRPQFPNDTLEPDWDVLDYIVGLKKRHSEITINWIKSHQDKDTPKERLPLMAQLNCEADELAADAHQLPKRSDTPRFPSNSTHVLCNNTLITAKLKNTIRTSIKIEPMKAHVQRANNWTSEVMNHIDWESHQRAVTSSGLPNRFATKLIHNILPTGKVIHRYQKYYDHHCPHCGQPYEDQAHLLSCPSTDCLLYTSDAADDTP